MFNTLNEAMMGKVPTGIYFVYRMLCLPVLYFFLSLLYLALSCAWMIRFDKFYGRSGYIIYWMLSWGINDFPFTTFSYQVAKAHQWFVIVFRAFGLNNSFPGKI